MTGKDFRVMVYNIGLVPVTKGHAFRVFDESTALNLVPLFVSILKCAVDGDYIVRNNPDRQASSETATADDISQALTLDAVLEVLANQRRRFVLYALTEASDGIVDLSTLIEEVATLEVGITDQGLTRDRYLEIASDLYHWHLDVLADVGVIEYDERSKVIRYREEPLLETWLNRIRISELS